MSTGLGKSPKRLSEHSSDKGQNASSGSAQTVRANENLRQNVLPAKRPSAFAETNLKAMAEELQALGTKFTAVCEQLAAADELILEMKAQLEQQQVTLSREKKQAPIEAERTTAKKQFDALQVELSVRKNEHSKLSNRLAAAEAQLAEQQRRINETEAELVARIDEITSLKADARGKLPVVSEQGALWLTPLMKLFDELRLPFPDVANVSTALAKKHYTDDPFSTLLLSSLADALDPRPFRRKWYGFTLLKMGFHEEAMAVLSPLDGVTNFSPSEQRAFANLKALLSLRKAHPQPDPFKSAGQPEKVVGPDKQTSPMEGRLGAFLVTNGASGVEPDRLVKTSNQEKTRRDASAPSAMTPPLGALSVGYQHKTEVIPAKPVPQPKADVLDEGHRDAPAAQRPVCLGVVDPFTRSCLRYEVQLEADHGPDDWQSVAARLRPDFVFVESAWNANGGKWQYRVAQYQKKFPDAVGDLLTWAGKNGVPSVFWNKEDPFHFERFIPNARRFDLIVTTDASCVRRYEEAGIKGRAVAMPFAAQPQLHNPIVHSPRFNGIAFAGSYYADRHDERRHDMELILDPARDLGLHIYDRGGDPTVKPSDVVRWPDKYQPHIAGSLPYDLVVQAYRRYKVFLNVNSIKTSKTMFSRRVIELLACGTPVISSPSEGLEEMFGDIVMVSRSAQETRTFLETILQDDDEWARRSALGVRRILSKHTYADMLEAVGSMIGVKATQARPALTVVIRAGTRKTGLEEIRATLESQTVLPNRIIIVTDQQERAEALFGSIPGLDDLQVIAWADGASALQIENAVKAEGGIVALMDERATYSPGYLEDARNAFLYWDGDLIGKHTHYGADELQNPGFENTPVTSVIASSLSLRSSALSTPILQRFVSGGWYKSEVPILALHRFSFQPRPVVPPTSKALSI